MFNNKFLLFFVVIYFVMILNFVQGQDDLRGDGAEENGPGIGKNLRIPDTLPGLLGQLAAAMRGG